MRMALVITGGSADPAFASHFVKTRKDGYQMTVAVDGGLALCDEAGIRPTHLVGDFDTADPDLLKAYSGMEGVQTIRHDPEKDATDTELALRLCAGLGMEEVHILAGTGSRLDHSLANIHLLTLGPSLGCRFVMYDRQNKLYLAQRSCRISRREQYGDYVSLLALTPKVTGLSLRGFKYGLKDRDISFGSSLCVSNEITAEQGEISFSEGILLVAEARD